MQESKKLQQIRHIPWHHGRPGGSPAARLRPMALLVVATLAMAACAESSPPDEQIPDIGAQLATGCVATGMLRADLSVAIGAKLNWGPEELACEGMRRPADAGARLRFSGPYDDGKDQRTLTLILGMPALEEAQIGAEIPTKVTLVEEGSGRFFATPDANGCWTDVTEHEHIDGDSDQHYVISGNVYCVSPLAEINGSASVTFTELAFTGRVNWESQERQE